MTDQAVRGRHLVTRLWQSGLLRRMGTLALGTAGGQLIMLLAAPLLTRLFAPEAFGAFGLYSGLAFVGGALVTLRYELAIVLAPTARQAAAAFALSVVIGVGLAVVSGLVLVLGGATALAGLFGIPTLAPILQWLPLQLLGLAAWSILGQWATRKHRIGALAQYQVLRSLLIIVAQMSAEVLVFGAEGLAAAQALGFGVAALWLFAKGASCDLRVLRSGFRLQRMSLIARRFVRLPRYSAPQEVLSSLSQPLISMALAALFTPVVVGHYWLTQRVMQQPGAFMGQAIRQTLVAHMAAQVHAGDDLRPLLLRSSLALAALTAALLAPVIMAGPALFSLVFGSGWAPAGVFAQVLSVWVIALLVQIPAYCALQALGRQRDLLVWDSIVVVGQTAALLACGVPWGPLAGISALSCVGALLFFGRSIWAYQCARRALAS